MMSSMVTRFIAPLLFTASIAAMAGTLVPELPIRTPPAPSSAAAPAPPGTAAPAPALPRYDPLYGAIAEWNRLRQSDSHAFSDYSRFLIAHPGWPGEANIRRAAERRIDPASYSPPEVAAFFTLYPPLTNTGRVRLAEALSAMGRPVEARAAAHAAWTGGVLNPDDESRLLSRFGTQFTSLDHDRRMEQLLWDRATTAAARQLVWASAARRPLYEARMAMQLRQPDAPGKAALAGPGADRDPGYLIDRALWLRDTG